MGRKPKLDTHQFTEPQLTALRRIAEEVDPKINTDLIRRLVAKGLVQVVSTKERSSGYSFADRVIDKVRLTPAGIKVLEGHLSPMLTDVSIVP